MDTQPQALPKNPDAKGSRSMLRRLDLAPAPKRDQVLQRVRAARKRLPQGPAGGRTGRTA